jgi:hypothetical protein
MQTADHSMQSEVRLVAQRALLGEVTPRLRCVSFDIADGRLRARFEFDGDPTDEERECASVVMTNIIAALSPTILFTEEFLANPFPHPCNSLTIRVYARNEMHGIAGLLDMEKGSRMTVLGRKLPHI